MVQPKMSDRAAIIDMIGEAWDKTDLPQTQFAELLREEADLYDEAPEEARSPRRVGGTDERTDV